MLFTVVESFIQMSVDDRIFVFHTTFEPGDHIFGGNANIASSEIFLTEVSWKRMAPRERVVIWFCNVKYCFSNIKISFRPNITQNVQGSAVLISFVEIQQPLSYLLDFALFSKKKQNRVSFWGGYSTIYYSDATFSLKKKPKLLSHICAPWIFALEFNDRIGAFWY